MNSIISIVVGSSLLISFLAALVWMVYRDTGSWKEVFRIFFLSGALTAGAVAGIMLLVNGLVERGLL